MNYEALFKPYEGRVVRVGLVGAGDFGTSLLAQVQCIPNLEIVVVCDTNLAQIDAAIASAGVERNAIAAVTSMKDATDVEFDVMVEGTGSPIAAAECGVGYIAWPTCCFGIKRRGYFSWSHFVPDGPRKGAGLYRSRWRSTEFINWLNELG